MTSPALTGTPVPGPQTNTAVSSDLPAWYQQYTQTLGSQAMGLAQANNAQPLPAQSVAGFSADQNAGFQKVKDNQGLWQPYMNAGMALNNQIAGVSSKFNDYAQGVVAGPAMTTGSSIQPWAQGAQDAASGSSANWTDNVSKYMSPYTTAVVDNIGRLGARNWEETIMPGVNSSMIGSGNFGSTRNADILSRAGVRAADDITGQQSNALQAGYTGAAGIFATDANRAQNQQQLQAQTALAGGTMMQGALSTDANRIQQQQQLQAQTALTGGVNAVNAINSQVDNNGALSQIYQTLGNNDAQSLINIGGIQQKNQQAALDASYANAMAARDDPWKQLTNAQSIINGVQLPKTTTSATSGTSNISGPSPAAGALTTTAVANSLLNPKP